MPEGGNEIHPLEVSVSSFGTREDFVYTGKHLVGQGNEIALQGNAGFHVKIVLAAKDFQLLSYSIHRCIFSQIHPMVKSKLCNF